MGGEEGGEGGEEGNRLLLSNFSISRTLKCIFWSCVSFPGSSQACRPPVRSSCGTGRPGSPAEPCSRMGGADRKLCSPVQSTQPPCFILRTVKSSGTF